MSREIIEAQRAGYVAGKRAASKGKWTERKQVTAQAEAAKAYPITQPRIITSGGRQFKVIDGKMHMKSVYGSNHGSWVPLPNASPAHYQALLDLYANPTEEVE